jgi:hypothetical protein
MTPAAIRTAVVEQAITGQLVNREQDQRLLNPTPEIDSLAEVLIALHGADDRRVRKALAVTGLGLVKQIRALNNTEHDCHQEVAGTAERLGRDAWTIKRLATELRPLLGDLANPMIRGRRRDERLERLAEIVSDAPRENLRSASLRNEIGLRKFDLLQQLLAGIEARS